MKKEIDYISVHVHNDEKIGAWNYCSIHRGDKPRLYDNVNPSNLRRIQQAQLSLLRIEPTKLTPIPVPFFPVFEVVIVGKIPEKKNMLIHSWEKLFIIAAEDKEMAVSMALSTTPIEFELDNEASTCRTTSALAPLKKIMTSVKI